jgi:hypothetical protein
MVFLLRRVPFLQRFMDVFFLGITVNTGDGEGVKDSFLKLSNDLAVGKTVALLYVLGNEPLYVPGNEPLYVPGNDPLYVERSEFTLAGLGNWNAGVGNRCGNGNSLLLFLLYIFLSGGGSGLGVINLGTGRFLNFFTGIILYYINIK